MRYFGGPWLLRLTMAATALLLLVKTANLIEAAAASVPQAIGPQTAATPAPPPPSAATAPLATRSACPPAVSPAELSVLGDLKARKAALDRRETTIAARETALTAAEKQVSARMVELMTLQKRIETETAAHRQAESARTMRLVALYEAMKPADAAAIFNELDRGVLLDVLGAMNVRRAAAIMAAMSPQRARLVTAELAAARAGHGAAASGSGG